MRTRKNRQKESARIPSALFPYFEIEGRAKPPFWKQSQQYLQQSARQNGLRKNCAIISGTLKNCTNSAQHALSPRSFIDRQTTKSNIAQAFSAYTIFPYRQHAKNYKRQYCTHTARTPRSLQEAHILYKEQSNLACALRQNSAANKPNTTLQGVRFAQKTPRSKDKAAR